MDKITEIEFQKWFGGDRYENWKDLTALILELANGEYEVEQLRIDVKDYKFQNDGEW